VQRDFNVQDVVLDGCFHVGVDGSLLIGGRWMVWAVEWDGLVHELMWNEAISPPGHPSEECGHCLRPRRGSEYRKTRDEASGGGGSAETEDQCSRHQSAIRSMSFS